LQLVSNKGGIHTDNDNKLGYNKLGYNELGYDEYLGIKSTYQLFVLAECHCTLKLNCDSRFQRAFTACIVFFLIITLVGSNQSNYFENATACMKRTIKTRVATHFKIEILNKFTTIFRN